MAQSKCSIVTGFMGINLARRRWGLQKMLFPISVPDSECCVLGCGKGWENPLSPLGLVGLRQVYRENACHFLWQRSVAALTNSVPTCLPQRPIPGSLCSSAGPCTFMVFSLAGLQVPQETSLSPVTVHGSQAELGMSLLSSTKVYPVASLPLPLSQQPRT